MPQKGPIDLETLPNQKFLGGSGSIEDNQDPFNQKKAGGPIDVDSQVVPAMGNKKPPKNGGLGGPEPIDDDAGLATHADNTPEPLSQADFKKAAQIVEIFGDLAARRIFSKVWQNREEGVSSLHRDVLDEGNYDRQQAFVQGVAVVAHTIVDKMAGVS